MITRRCFLNSASIAGIPALAPVTRPLRRACRPPWSSLRDRRHCDECALVRCLERGRDHGFGAERRCTSSTASSRRRRCISSAITQAFLQSILLDTNCSSTGWSKAPAQVLDGRVAALPVGVASSFHRVCRQWRSRAPRQSGSHRPIEPRSRELQRVERRSVEYAASRSEAQGCSPVDRGGRRRRVQACAQTPRSARRSTMSRSPMDRIARPCGLNKVIRWRLLVPGWEGNVSVKWLHRLHVTDRPAMSRDEAASYTDLMPNGRARQFSFEMETNSVITAPFGRPAIERRRLPRNQRACLDRSRQDHPRGGFRDRRLLRDAELQAPIYANSLTVFGCR